MLTYPLIEIQSVPIELEMKITDAHLEYQRGIVDMQVTRDKGGLSIKSSPIRLQMDTYEARNSVVPTISSQIRQSAAEGKRAAYEATATYARQGQLLLQAKIGQELETQFAEEATTKDLKTNVGISFIPTTGPNISWDKGEINIRYDMDKLNFDWRKQNGNFEFIPGDIEISVKQQPDVIIRYVGGPLYVPPSAAPDYQPIDVQA